MALTERDLADIRWGYGLSPSGRSQGGTEAMLAVLAPTDAAEGMPFPERAQLLRDFVEARRNARQQVDGAADAQKSAQAALRRQYFVDLRADLARAVGGGSPFRERLTAFWADHFAVRASSARLRVFAPDLVAQAIRPHVGGRFPDMLLAVATHPAMLDYLDQSTSIGPGSQVGQRRGRGLNENLAREILELHTLGVDADYAQKDVREFAELLTGMTFDDAGFRFRAQIAEPGAETVLGTRYGGRRAEFGAVVDALVDLALRPDTARHLAGKLIEHFVGGPPEQGHLDRVAEAYLASDGDLTVTYRALLADGAAWSPELRKVKTPFEFIVAGLRAFGVTAEDVSKLRPRELTRTVLRPLAAMGQPYMMPPGPDGWSEDPGDWISASGLAARILWARETAGRFEARQTPARFLETTLGSGVTPEVARATRRAESRADALAIVLASPEFNRR
ncbi:MAG: DUF1800 domain-containing protein [Pseudomonadota bacterium]